MNRKHTLLVGLVWVGLIPFYAAWLVQDRVVAPWDMSVHSGMAFDLWRKLSHFHPTIIYTLSRYYPPLFHLVAAPLSVFGGNPDIYCAANWLSRNSRRS